MYGWDGRVRVQKKNNFTILLLFLSHERVRERTMSEIVCRSDPQSYREVEDTCEHENES